MSHLNSLDIFNIQDIQNIIIDYKEDLDLLITNFFYCECCKDWLLESEIGIDKVEIEDGKIIEMCSDCRRDYDDVWGCESCDTYKICCSKQNGDSCMDCWISYFNRLKVKGLKLECKERGIKGYSRLRKYQLKNLLIDLFIY